MTTPWSTKWDMCPKDMRAIGFAIKAEEYKGSYKDDTSINGIALVCAALNGSLDESIKVTSDVGK